LGRNFPEVVLALRRCWQRGGEREGQHDARVDAGRESFAVVHAFSPRRRGMAVTTNMGAGDWGKNCTAASKRCARREVRPVVSFQSARLLGLVLREVRPRGFVPLSPGYSARLR